MTGPRLLVVEGNTAEGRARHAAVGGRVASEGYAEDLMLKAAKAQWYARHEGLAYGKILSFCPLNWRTADDAAQPVLQAAIDSCFFPLYEVEHGHTTVTYDPDATDRRHP